MKRAFLLFALLGIHRVMAQTPKESLTVSVPGAEANSSSSGGQVDYTFNPLNVKRDPFTPPKLEKRSPEDDLLRFDVGEMSLVGILTGMGAPQAMLLLPNGKTHVVQNGQSLGRRNGKVSSIGPNEVQIKESFRDFQNRLTTDTVTLVLAP
jgi:Tfp pilus assembly protein PilP